MDWTMEEAEQALAVDKEYNKKSKYGLIIKFPDQELNKEIVAQFHPAIDNVQFQQPCTPGFCFVTLQETADPDEVISVLNKQKFRDGYLTVDYKKDREDDQTINAEDIDPLTLYVGNLAQEITKDDLATLFPNGNRMDIGVAKKMKFTRYAFVGFRSVADSIEAFKKTHNQHMYNRSLIVRFKRLHRTVGMPGKSKPQNSPKNKEDGLDSLSLAADVLSKSTSSNRAYYLNRYPNSNNQYSGNQQHGWQQRNQSNYKRNQIDSSESEPLLNTRKKKKKSLSQNIPQNIPKKDWTMEEAVQALAVEKEYNKKSKYVLSIKFPDQELNKEIVAQFHPAIDNVQYQQPCTPGFCLVTLQETADPDEVISVLNKQKFGDGYLTVDYKKDREDDQTINAEDIDPLTLYVGNLAQEIKKDDLATLFPNRKRMDIGYAKKMKFTRYAFVGFRSVADSIEAFKKTHNQQMYNKSLIVRFKRLHGTVGFPGESKPQNPPRNKEDGLDSSSHAAV